MTQALWVAKTGLEAQQNKLAVISNNLANVSTTGFKRDRMLFEDLLYQNIRQAGGQSSEDTLLPTGLMIGTGVRAVATQKQNTQGNISQTGNQLDLAVLGRGYFQILKPDGTTAYTRDGTFSVNQDGQVVTSSGYHLEPSITIPGDAQSVTIGTDGTVSISLPGNASSIAGVIQLADFINPAGLQPVGDNLFVETTASGTALINNPTQSGLGSLAQGSLEGSNVNIVEELVSMIETQRAYEMNSKAISTADEMLQYVNNNL